MVNLINGCTIYLISTLLRIVLLFKQFRFSLQLYHFGILNWVWTGVLGVLRVLKKGQFWGLMGWVARSALVTSLIRIAFDRVSILLKENRSRLILVTVFRDEKKTRLYLAEVVHAITLIRDIGIGVYININSPNHLPYISIPLIQGSLHNNKTNRISRAIGEIMTYLSIHTSWIWGRGALGVAGGFETGAELGLVKRVTANPQKLSIYYRSFSNRSKAQVLLL